MTQTQTTYSSEHEMREGDLVVFTDFRGLEFGGRLERIIDENNYQVRGIGLDQHDYSGMVLALDAQQVRRAI